MARLDKFGKITHEFEIFREQEWRSGESTRLPPMWPGVRILASTPLCGLSLLLVLSLVSRGFLRELQFFPLLKNQHFQIPIRSGAHGHVSTSCHELLSAPWVPNYNLQLQLQFSGSKAEYFFEPLPTSYIVFPCEFGYDATAS